DQLAELEARVVVFAGGHGDADGPRHLRASRDVIGQRGFLVPDEAQVLQELGLVDGRGHVELLVNVDHHLHGGADSLAYCLHALGVPRGTGGVDFHVVGAAPRRSVTLALADQVVDGVGAPAATAVGVDAVPGRAPQLGQG